MAIVRPLRLLRWLYLGRLTLAAGIFGGALLVWRGTAPETTLLATLALLLSVAMTLASLWWTHVLQRTPGENFMYAQVIFDTLLVTAVVHLTQGPRSEFSPLYILVIAAGALVLPLRGGMLISGLASMLYFADIVWLQTTTPPPGTLLLQILVFVLVALATGALGDRLRRTGTALGVAESKLEQLQLETDEILGAIDTGVATVDGTGRLVYLNTAGEQLLKLWRREWQGERVVDAMDQRFPGLGAVIGETSESRTPVRQAQLRGRAPEGDRMLGVRTTVLDRLGAPWVTAVFQDITEAKRVEALTRRADRLQAVAQLGASLAHEIKNPLASIRSAIEQLAGPRLQKEDPELLSNLVLSESDRLSRLLSDFMEFSRVELRRRSMVDMRQVTTQAIGLVARHPDSTQAVINYDPPGEALCVDGDEDLLHRAVFNLVLNAVQHAGAEGRVDVQLTRAANGPLPHGIALEAPVVLAVKDSGPGIDAEDVTRVFDPFFTTRKGGTGLGLALVHRAVEAHSGAVIVDSGLGEGAQFTVYLPAHEEKG
jgi:two-component system sensor histidine kinase PilS (NtrC family)